MDWSRPPQDPPAPRIEPDEAGPIRSRPRSARRRLLQGLLLRLLLSPLLAGAMLVVLVYGTTHRWPWQTPCAPADSPASIGLFYRDVTLRTGDGVELAAWHVPAWSARQFAAGVDRNLGDRRPAVVLCHGPWADRSQMLYLAPDLHAAGYELLLVDLRGCGGSGGSIALGLDEWQDMQAAVAWVQKLSAVDPRRVALVAGECYGAAALRAAAANPAVRVVAADRPARNLRSFLAGRFERVGLPGEPLGRLYEWTLAMLTVGDTSGANAECRAAEIGRGQALMVAVRGGDGGGGDDAQTVLAAGDGAKALRPVRAPPDSPRQPAILPRDLVRFLAGQL